LKSMDGMADGTEGLISMTERHWGLNKMTSVR